MQKKQKIKKNTKLNIIMGFAQIATIFPVLWTFQLDFYII